MDNAMDKFFQKVIPSEQIQMRDQYNGYNLATNPDNPLTLVGKGWNRWESLFFDPQKNCIEKFQRGGENSVLQELDHHTKQCFETYANAVRFK
jgi:hypothetical protein